MTVLGAARSGTAAARLLRERGARVFLSDNRTLSASLKNELLALDIEVEEGGHTKRTLAADFLVLSPGVPSTSPIPVEAGRLGIPCYSELEVASWFCEGSIVAITGSNGKTTTTLLTGHVFAHAGYETVVAGNVGIPLSACVDTTGPETIVVLEVSSFQLDHIDTFKPQVSVLLNITPDHLDRYEGKFSLYTQSKLRIAMNQTGNDVIIYNHDDTLVRDHIQPFVTTTGVRGIPFSTRESLAEGASLSRDMLVLNLGDGVEQLLPTDVLAMRGPHNVQNAMAAAIAARVMDVKMDSLRESLSAFEGVPHRLEHVRKVDGVAYVNDSKATNVNAVWYAIQSFSSPLLLLAGGRDKGNNYEELRPLMSERVRTLIAFGESAPTIIRELGSSVDDAVAVETLEEATRAARTKAWPGDTVLLSPACASFDQFRNYEHRGDSFKALVKSF